MYILYIYIIYNYVYERSTIPYVYERNDSNLATISAMLKVLSTH